MFTPKIGEMIPISRAYFSDGLVKNHQLVMLCDRWWMALEAALGVTFVDGTTTVQAEGGDPWSGTTW